VVGRDPGPGRVATRGAGSLRAVRDLRRPVTALLLGLTLLTAPAACGFADAGSRPAGKPDAVLVRGRVAVPLPADTRAPGSACAAPAGVPGIASGAAVTVTDENGRPIAQGELGVGVVAVEADRHECDFPFEVPGVPGDHGTVGISVAGRPAQDFPLRDLAEDRPAVVTVPS
jgi:hypothetical protein